MLCIRRRSLAHQHHQRNIILLPIICQPPAPHPQHLIASQPGMQTPAALRSISSCSARLATASAPPTCLACLSLFCLFLFAPMAAGAPCARLSLLLRISLSSPPSLLERERSAELRVAARQGHHNPQRAAGTRQQQRPALARPLSPLLAHEKSVSSSASLRSCLSALIAPASSDVFTCGGRAPSQEGGPAGDSMTVVNLSVAEAGLCQSPRAASRPRCAASRAFFPLDVAASSAAAAPTVGTLAFSRITCSSRRRAAGSSGGHSAPVSAFGTPRAT